MKKSLNKKFAIIFLSLLVALFVVLLIAVQIVARVFTQDYVNDDVLALHNTMSNEITDILNEINYGYTRITQSDALPQVLTADGEERQEAFSRLLDNVSLSNDYVNVVMSFNNVTLSEYEQYNMPTKSFVSSISQGTDILYFGEVNSSSGYAQIGRRFQNSLNNVDGVVVFYVSLTAFNDICSLTDYASGYTQIITSDYTIIAKSDGNDVGKTILEQSKFPLQDKSIVRERLDGKNSLVATTSVSNQYNLSWYLISVLDNDVLQKDFTTLSWVLAILASISFALVLFLSLRIARRTVAPINNLSNQLSTVDFQKRQGLLNIGADGDELFELERNYDEMIARLFRLMDENKENMENQRKLEIDALQMQINPHFLYNTLDAIAWMAKIKKQPEIEKLVINLAKFFRLSLHKGDKFIYIKEETELIEHYLEIEKIRFPNTINYVCDLPDGIGEYKTLKLILQPIVENCIKHGFYGKEGIGTITISARQEGDDIILDVTDDGCGFEVADDFWTQKTDKPNGYGLYNVNERIRLEYGDGYGLSIVSEKGVGTTVTARIKKSV